MSSKAVDTINSFFIDITKLKYIYNACIVNIKIKHVNISGKILGHDKISIYGDYELFILYEVRKRNNKFKYLLKTEIKRFYKVISNNYDINFEDEIDYLIEPTFIEKPKCIYRKGHYRDNYYYRWFNFCKILLFGELKLNIYIMSSKPCKQISKTNTNDNNCNYKLTNEFKKLIDTNVVIAHGEKDTLINKEITLEDGWPEIWKIETVDYNVEVEKKDIIKENIIVSGYVNISINYKTYENSINGIVQGVISYIESRIPFSLCIKMNHCPNIVLDKHDNCKILEATVIDGVYNLQETFENSDGILLYKKVNQSILLKIKSVITRNQTLEVDSFNE